VGVCMLCVRVRVCVGRVGSLVVLFDVGFVCDCGLFAFWQTEFSSVSSVLQIFL